MKASPNSEHATAAGAMHTPLPQLRPSADEVLQHSQAPIKDSPLQAKYAAPVVAPSSGRSSWLGAMILAMCLAVLAWFAYFEWQWFKQVLNHHDEHIQRLNLAAENVRVQLAQFGVADEQSARQQVKKISVLEAQLNKHTAAIAAYEQQVVNQDAAQQALGEQLVALTLRVDDIAQQVTRNAWQQPIAELTAKVVALQQAQQQVVNKQQQIQLEVDDLAARLGTLAKQKLSARHTQSHIASFAASLESLSATVRNNQQSLHAVDAFRRQVNISLDQVQQDVRALRQQL